MIYTLKQITIPLNAPEDQLILDNTLLMVLEHFRIAKVDYAKNVTKYTEIQRDIVNQCIRNLESQGFLEKYTNTSIKRTAAKLKKSPEVHKHHTYYQITRSGILALNNINPKRYLAFLAEDCISYLEGRKGSQTGGERESKLVKMGLINRDLKLTMMGKKVLNEIGGK